MPGLSAWGEGMEERVSADAAGQRAAASAGSAGIVKQKPLVITVHGTFAAHVDDDGEQWWQRGSAFTTALAERLSTKGIPGIEVQPFHWSGLNSDQARLGAASVLSSTLAAAKREGRPVAALAHSHGGNVLMEALVQRRTRKPLAAVLTLGTPFFRRRLKPLPTLIALFKVLLGLAVAPAMLMYAWMALPTALDGSRIELLALPLLILVGVVWAFMSGARALVRQRWAKRRARMVVDPARWLVIQSPRDEAMRLLESAVAVKPVFVSRASAHGQWVRFGTVAGVLGTIAFLFFTGSYFLAPIFEKVAQRDFGPGIIADFTFMLVIPVVFALIYAAIRLFSWTIGARLLSSLLNVSIHGGIVGAAYGGDDVYALTGVARVPPYLPGVREQRVSAATLGGIDDNAIIEAAREFYSEIVAEEVAEMTFADPDLLMKRMTDALYHNAYMRDRDIVEAVADHLARNFLNWPPR
jgi:hypothetical protein